MHNNHRIVFIHGSGQSPICWNFYDVFLPEHIPLHISYDVRDDAFLIRDRIKQQLLAHNDGSSVTIIAHSYGCLIAALLLDQLPNISKVFAISPPWGGSHTAKWLSRAFRTNTLFKNTTPNSVLLEKINTINSDTLIHNIVTTGGANALAGLGDESSNDGMITVASQLSCPQSFTNTTTKKFSLSHGEVLLSFDVVEYITNLLFGNTND